MMDRPRLQVQWRSDSILLNGNPSGGFPLLFFWGGFISLGLERFDQTLGSYFAQVEYALKTLRIAVIGVWHFIFDNGGGEIKEQGELGDMLRRAALAQLGQVVFVHGQDQVETLEVYVCDAP